MRSTLLIFLALCLISVCHCADDQYDYDDEPAAAPTTPAPTKPSSRLGSLLSSRARSPVARKPSTTSTTPKPTEEPVEEVVNEGDEVYDENQESETPTTTTEAAKKLRGGIRPFRSNEDLLAALKRRRAQANSIARETTTTTTQSSADSSTSKSKSLGGRNKNESVTKPTRNRFGTPGRGKIAQEEVQETQQDEVQLKNKPYRRG
ncbi:hypothetical protein HCN44_003143 [Aphidius gifuensis]|uniref:Uncharacterized protein n=1 Tax=Aphidius gifuensis TaxID=684658 RepID=A0A834XK05_APHGI|nr:hypothetical protein HCN44_003143 [Aphidius gifuensis]